MVDRNGGGDLDQVGLIAQLRNKQLTTTAKDAVHDMLKNSGNTPVRLIAEQFSDGGAELSQMYRDLGYENTTLEAHQNGRFNFELSTPRETLQSFQRLLTFPDQGLDTELAQTAANALWETGDKHGVKQGIRTSGNIKVASKSG